MAMMPGRENAYVDRSKVADYLLATTHPDGRSKAEFFQRFGFSIESDDVFITALVDIARDSEVVEVVESAFGTRYVIDGLLQAPNGRRPAVRTVWIVEAARPAPRLVTAYPLERK